MADRLRRGPMSRRLVVVVATAAPDRTGTGAPSTRAIACTPWLLWLLPKVMFSCPVLNLNCTSVTLSSSGIFFFGAPGLASLGHLGVVSWHCGILSLEPQGLRQAVIQGGAEILPQQNFWNQSPTTPHTPYFDAVHKSPDSNSLLLIRLDTQSVAQRAAKMPRKLKFHEQKLLKKWVEIHG